MMSIKNHLQEGSILKHKGRHYYPAEEADRLMDSTLQEANSARAALTDMQASQQQLVQANEKQSATIAAYRTRIETLDSLNNEQIQEINLLGEQLAVYRNENLIQSEKISQLTAQVSHLQAHIKGLEEQLASLEAQNTDALRTEAIQKADEIIDRAVADSNRILAQAAEQRGRLVSACRAAYYSALQFKKDLAEQFKNMEQELDESIDVLQFIDNSNVNIQHVKPVRTTPRQREEMS